MNPEDEQIRRPLRSVSPNTMRVLASNIETLEYNSFSTYGPKALQVDGTQHGGKKQRHKMSLRSVAFHIFKGNVGAGVFLLPTFYQTSGYLLGAIVIALLSIIIVDCTLALIEVKQKLADPALTTYPAVVRFVLGSKFEMYTNVSLSFTQFGFCVMYLQYSSSMMAAITNKESHSTFFLILCTIIVTPLTFLSHRMEQLAYGSLVASISVSIALVGTAVVACRTLASDGIAAQVYSVVWTPKILLFFSGYLFSLEGIGIVLPIEECLEASDRPKFPSFIKKVLFSIIIMYFCFGVLGYVAYGENLTTSVVLALPDGALKKSMEFLVALSLILSFPVQYVPAIQLIDSALDIHIETKFRSAILLRTGINVALACVAGIFGPQALNMMASFIGAFGGVHLMITIPTLLSLLVDLAIEDTRNERTRKQCLMYVLKGAKREKRIRRLFYLILTLLVWLGGLFYTGLAIFNDSASEGVGPAPITELAQLPLPGNTTGVTL